MAATEAERGRSSQGVETLFSCIAMEFGYHKSGCALGVGTRRKAPENTKGFYEITQWTKLV
jgi:hypothetical protein